MLSAGAVVFYLRQNGGHLLRPSPLLVPALVRCSFGTSVIVSDDFRDSFPSNRGVKCVLKPPNVLIYTGENSNLNDQRFHQIQTSLSKCLCREKYLIYKLTDDQIKTEPWRDNAAMLVVACQDVDKGTSSLIREYVHQGGTLLSLCSSLVLGGVKCKRFCHFESLGLVSVLPELTGEASDLQMLIGECIFQVSPSNPDVKVLARSGDIPVLVSVRQGKGQAVLSQVHLEDTVDEVMDSLIFTELKKAAPKRLDLLRDLIHHLGFTSSSTECPALTPAYLLGGKESKAQLIQCLRKLLAGKETTKTRGISLQPVESASSEPFTTESVLPVITEDEERHCVFDWDTYQENLETKRLGRLVIYADVVSSTQSILESNSKLLSCISDDVGLVVSARYQASGRGRGGNAWISPFGCMMFSAHVRIGINTELGSSFPCLQHLASLAVVQAVRTLEGYEDINLRVKWPNDIYYGKDIKMGGVIVNSSVVSGTFNAIIGMGFNVNNSDPTLCLNDLIKQHNRQHGTNLSPLSIERVLARTFNTLETLIDNFHRGGAATFLPLYYERWLHSNVKVTLDEEKKEEVTIVGLDDTGFLSVQKANGQIMSVQPDGNSFDMMRNLISIKR